MGGQVPFQCPLVQSRSQAEWVRDNQGGVARNSHMNRIFFGGVPRTKQACYACRASCECELKILHHLYMTSDIMNGQTTARQLYVETPLLKSRKLSDRQGCNVWLKLENVQNSGSFKARGLGHLCNKVGTTACMIMEQTPTH